MAEEFEKPQYSEQEQIRRAKLAKYCEEGRDPYTITRFDRTHTSAQILADFDALDTGGEGIGQRLYNASREASSLSAILDAAKTRRYAYARLRRMVLWAYLGLTPADVPAHVPYLRVLAANETGRTLLHQMRKRAQLPVITKPAAVRQLSPEAQALFRLEARGADLYALAYPALSAAAGPASNLLLAWVSMILYKLCWYSGLGDAVPVLMMFLYYMVAMNLSLAVFNLLPVPPFDGSRIALLFLPQRLYFRAMKYERYIMLAVLALVFLGLLDAPLSWLVNGMWRLMLHLTGFVELLWGY